HVRQPANRRARPGRPPPAHARTGLRAGPAPRADGGPRPPRRRRDGGRAHGRRVGGRSSGRTPSAGPTSLAAYTRRRPGTGEGTGTIDTEPRRTTRPTTVAL